MEQNLMPVSSESLPDLLLCSAFYILISLLSKNQIRQVPALM